MIKICFRSYFRTGMCLLICILSQVRFAQAQTTPGTFYKAFVQGDMKLWKSEMDKLATRSASSQEQLALAGYYYGYIGYSLGVKNKKEAQIYVDKGEAMLEDLANTMQGANLADVYAFRAAFVGFKIGISPMKAPFIGRSSMGFAKKALEINTNSVQANIEQANILYYAPSAFGGDKVAAKQYYQKAINLLEASRSLCNENWLYLSILTIVGQLYADEKNYVQAKQAYEKILIIEPNYRYVRDELLPDLLKKM